MGRQATRAQQACSRLSVDLPIQPAAGVTILTGLWHPVSMMVKLVEPQGRKSQLGRQWLSFLEQAVKSMAKSGQSLPHHPGSLHTCSRFS